MIPKVGMVAACPNVYTSCCADHTRGWQRSGGKVFSISPCSDCVDHGILLHKLRVYGVRCLALDWFRLYLTNRQQYITAKNKLTDIRSVDSGANCSF